MGYVNSPVRCAHYETAHSSLLEVLAKRIKRIPLKRDLPFLENTVRAGTGHVDSASKANFLRET